MGVGIKPNQTKQNSLEDTHTFSLPSAMVDPISTFSLAVSIIDAFKETYLLGKYVYRTVHSAMNHKAERQEIENDFHFELLKLQTFGRWF